MLRLRGTNPELFGIIDEFLKACATRVELREGLRQGLLAREGRAHGAGYLELFGSEPSVSDMVARTCETSVICSTETARAAQPTGTLAGGSATHDPTIESQRYAEALYRDIVAIYDMWRRGPVYRSSGWVIY